MTAASEDQGDPVEVTEELLAALEFRYAEPPRCRACGSPLQVADSRGMKMTCTVLHDEECSCDRKYLMSCPNMAAAIPRSGPAAGGDGPAESAPEFGDRFTVIPDSGEVELHCTSHSPMARTWKVGYHPSLDVLVEQARAHNAAEHGEGTGRQ